MQFLWMIAGILTTVICWGVYGPVLHIGQAGFKSAEGEPLPGFRLKALVCVGLAYFIVAIILPMAYLALNQQTKGWTLGGISWSLIAGSAGALGAMGIIMALSNGGSPPRVMPIVFGCAPVITVISNMIMQGTYKENVNPLFYAGMILSITGAVTVLTFAPKPSKGKGHGKAKNKPAAVASKDAGKDAGKDANH